MDRDLFILKIAGLCQELDDYEPHPYKTTDAKNLICQLYDTITLFISYNKEFDIIYMKLIQILKSINALYGSSITIREIYQKSGELRLLTTKEIFEKFKSYEILFNSLKVSVKELLSILNEKGYLNGD